VRGRGQPLFSVPAGAWLTADAVARSALGPLVAGLEPWLQLALFLLAERAAPRSPWRPYLDALPDACGAPLFWSDAELAELEGTQVLTSVRGYRRAPASAVLAATPCVSRQFCTLSCCPAAGFWKSVE